MGSALDAIVLGTGATPPASPAGKKPVSALDAIVKTAPAKPMTAGNHQTTYGESLLTDEERSAVNRGQLANQVLQPIIKNPLTDIGRNSASKTGQVGGAYLESLLNTLSEMTSPLNLATAGVVGQAGRLAKLFSGSGTAAATELAPRLVKNPAPKLDAKGLEDTLNEIRLTNAKTGATSLPPEPSVAPASGTASAAETRARQLVQGRPVTPEPIAAAVPKVGTATEEAVAQAPFKTPAATGQSVPARAFSPNEEKSIQSLDHLLGDRKVPVESAQGTYVESPQEIVTNLKAVRQPQEFFQATDEAAQKLIDDGRYDDAANVIEKSLDHFFGHWKDTAGKISTGTALAVGGGVTGAAIGGTQGTTPGEHLRNAAIGGTAGALVVPALGAALTVGLPKAAQGYLYTSVLSSPSSILKAYNGAVGGTIAAAVEKLTSGQSGEGAAILQRLFNPATAARFLAALRKGGPNTFGYTAGTQSPGLLQQVYGAMDAAVRPALRAGGVTDENAARYMLSGQPTSKMGKDVLNLFNQHFSMRLIGSLFPRVGIQIIERGIERSPLALLPKVGEQVATSANRFEQVVKALVLGPAVASAAYLGADRVPDKAKPFVAAAAGPYALPTALAFAAQKGADPVTEFAQNLPFPQYGPADAIKNLASGAPLVPNLVRDVARATDPHERQTSGGTKVGPINFGRMEAKVPGLREQLPVKAENRNIAGQPTEDRSTWLQRFISPAAASPSPMAGIPPAVAQEIQRLDVKIDIPSFERKAKVGRQTVDVPPDAAERAREERRQFLLPWIEKLLGSERYQRSDDVKKKSLLTNTIKQAEAAGSARANAHLTALLRRSR